ncbi:MAG TPA: hypothetical protein V6D27_12420 [Vampirovibrionales bacterium]
MSNRVAIALFGGVFPQKSETSTLSQTGKCERSPMELHSTSVLLNAVPPALRLNHQRSPVKTTR